ncbi:MAG: radical SAM protein [Candidatus Bathyarchaeota archaeon]|nr:radical SAM protein [Candidatus Bathyarchaeum sp.]
MVNINPLKLNMPVMRTLRLYSKIKLKVPSPMFVAWDITYKCNLDCFFCDRQTIYRDKLNNDLTLNEAKTVIDKLADADVMTIGITGGEALLRPDLEDIVEYAVDRELVVTLSTNGTLMTESRAQALGNLCQSISISFDGLADTHNDVRGKKGAYADAIRGLKILAETKPRSCAVGVNFVLNKRNYKELREVFDAVRNVGADYFFVQPVIGSSSWVIPKDAIDGSVKQILELKTNYCSHISQSYYFLSHISEYINGTAPKLCDAGTLYLAVNNEGKLFLCPGIPRTKETYIGSLLQHSMVDLLKSKRMKKVKETIIPNCNPCLMNCTTEFSLLAKSPLKTILSKYSSLQL